MTRPQRHQKTGVYYLRKRVPAPLLSLVGSREIKFSLGTKDPAEAKRRLVDELAKIEVRWANLQKGLLRPTPLECNVMAGDFYRTIVEGYEKGPIPFFGNAALSGMAKDLVASPLDKVAHAKFLSFYGTKIEQYLEKVGKRIHPDHRVEFEVAVARAVNDASKRGIEFLTGNFGEDVQAKRYASAPSSSKPIPVLQAFDVYAKAASLSPATIKRWRPALVVFVQHCGHDDLSRVTQDDVASWITSLRTSGRSARTIRDVYVAAAKALYSYQTAEKGLRSNPFTGFRVKVPEKRQLRTRALTDAEAKLILEASLAPQQAKIAPAHRAARRWVPWLAAYSGARVNELTQLRAMDIRMEEDVWVMHITPEAGSVKTGKARLIPLHPHLLEQGFLTYVQAVRSGPLFYSDLPSSASAANPPYKKMGERLAKWVREIGVDDPDVDPNHGWRHRFKSVGRQIDVEEHILDVLQGHALATEGRRYGEFKPAKLLRAIAMMPRYEIAK